MLTAPALSAASLIPNPGFEKWQDGLPSGWTDTTQDTPSHLVIKQISEGAPTGKSCLQLSDAWAGNHLSCYGLATAENIPLEPGKRYLFRMQYKNNAGAFPWTNKVQFTFHAANGDILLYKLTPAARLRWKNYRHLLPPLPKAYDSVTISIGLAGASRDLLLVDDVSLRPATKSERKRYQRPRKARLAPIPEFKPKPNGEATGFTHTKYLQNAWWLVAPDGKRLWSIGCGGTKTSAKKINKKSTRLSLKRWGFNSLSVDSDPSFIKKLRQQEKQALKAKEGEDLRPLLPFINLRLFSLAKPDFYLRDMLGNHRGRSILPMVDPYNPSWRAAAQKKVKKIAKNSRESAWFGGYIADSMIDLSCLPLRLWGTHSGPRFVAWLEEKYGADITKLNKKWCADTDRAPFASFTELATNKAEPKGYDDPAFNDFLAFARILLKEYVDFVIATIKDADPNHLVLSSVITPDQVMELERYPEIYHAFDAIAFGISPAGNVAGFDGGELSMILKIHQSTRRPLLITGLSVGALDSNLYTPPFHNNPLSALPAQADRAAVYYGCLSQMASLPYILGVHWSNWQDLDIKTQRIIIKWNDGLVNDAGKPYAPLVEKMKVIHTEIINKKGLRTRD